MTEQAPDDIFALYSRYDLDGENYRVFPRLEPPAKPTVVKPEHIADVSVEKEWEPALATAGPVQQVVPASVLKPSSSEKKAAEILHAGPIPAKALESEGSRRELQNLSRHVTSAREAGPVMTAASLAAASIAIHGAAGGVGTTTIAAALTRLLAKSGRRCAIFNEADDSILPLFFGAQRISEDHRRFSGLHSLFVPRIRIFNREMFEPSKPSATDGSSFIERNFSDIAGEFDHVIFDHPARFAESMGAGLTIYVAIPDLSSLVGTRKLKRSLETAGVPAKAVCVLNRFDSASALHQEVLGWYLESFQDVVIIHNSPLVPEALAEGTTVMDWAPDANVSADFLKLFTTVAQLLSCESERLTLCS